MHQTNPMDKTKTPKSLVWRKYTNGTLKSGTAEDRKIGPGGGKVASFFKLGKVVYVCKYYEKMNGKLLPEFATDNSAEMFCNSCNLGRSIYFCFGWRFNSNF